jgi:hypothetical protein
MTTKELLEQILALGGRTQLNYTYEKNAVYVAINRAIDEVNRIFPVEKTIQLIHYPIIPSVHYAGIAVHRGGEDKEYYASDARALAFAISGTGRAILSGWDEDKETWVPIKTFIWQEENDFAEIKYMIPEYNSITEETVPARQIKLVFEGEYSYMIRDVSIYSELASDRVEDVKVYQIWVPYDLADVQYAGGGFMDFASEPVLFGATELTTPHDFKIEDSRVYLPATKPGVYTIRYRYKPNRVEVLSEDVDVDLDSEMVDLVAPRAAYYLFYTTDEEVADRCLAEYQKLYATYMRTRKTRTPIRQRDLTGW